MTGLCMINGNTTSFEIDTLGEQTHAGGFQQEKPTILNPWSSQHRLTF